MEKKKKPFYKKWWVWLIAIIIVFAYIGSEGTDETENKANQKEVEKKEVEKKEVEKKEVVEETDSTEETVAEESETEENDIPREHQNALKSAQNYIDIMAFSEKGLYEQLTSAFGDQYPEEAAQYAIENVKVDYNEEALESAINYQNILPMSNQELFDQLTSQYGDQFTEEQAQYAIDNLPE